jgi:hypothetical protein
VRKYNEETEETTLAVATKVAADTGMVETDLIDFVEESKMRWRVTQRIRSLSELNINVKKYSVHMQDIVVAWRIGWR